MRPCSLIYLDTHVLVWLYAGQSERFPASLYQRLNSQELLVSPMVELELRYLYEIERISVPETVVLTDLKQRLGLRCCDQPFAAVVAAATQQSWTRDPFDRLIVAQAALQQAALVSKDKMVLKHYALACWE